MSNARLSVLSLLFVLSLTFFQESHAQLAACPAAHCSSINAAVNQFCISNGDAGRKIPVQLGDGAWCYCGCSCVARGTTTFAYSSELPNDVAYPSYLPLIVDVGRLQAGQALYTPIASYTKIDRVMQNGSSDGQELLVISFNDGRSLTVSANHTFITPNETVIAANELKPRMKLLADKSRQVIRVKSIQRTRENHDLFNIILNPVSVYPEDHLWFTNGLWSGDWMLQTANDQIESEIKLRESNIAEVVHSLNPSTETK